MCGPNAESRDRGSFVCHSPQISLLIKKSGVVRVGQARFIPVGFTKEYKAFDQ